VGSRAGERAVPVAGIEVDEPEMEIGDWAGSRAGRKSSWAQEVSRRLPKLNDAISIKKKLK
jgi:hypothetical protein